MTSCAWRSASAPTPTPARQISISPMATSSLRGSMSTPELPMAARMRPQFGSAPKKAALHSGDGVLGAGDFDGHDVRGAFAIAHDLARQLVEDVVHRLTEGLAFVATVDGFIFRGATRHDRDHVVGRRVAVDGDGVERRLDLFA